MTEPVADPVRQPELPIESVLALLRTGEMELEGLLAEASNTTLRAFVAADGVRGRCVYKPVRGERPLWDFPDGTLAGREVGTFLISQASGLNVVPPTVLRPGPFGPGPNLKSALVAGIFPCAVFFSLISWSSGLATPLSLNRIRRIESCPP